MLASSLMQVSCVLCRVFRQNMERRIGLRGVKKTRRRCRMVQLPRLLPSPLPPVRYVPEYRAEGALKDAYEDMKSVLQVPWMGVVTMAYANFPHFFDAFWSGMRELCGGVEFEPPANARRGAADCPRKAMQTPTHT